MPFLRYCLPISKNLDNINNVKSDFVNCKFTIIHATIVKKGCILQCVHSQTWERQHPKNGGCDKG
jgi:hypothetical protein